MKIKADYNVIQYTGTFFEKQAKDLITLKTKLDNCINGISSCWEGEDASLFIQKSLDYSKSLNKVVDTIIKDGNWMKKRGVNYQKTSEEYIVSVRNKIINRQGGVGRG